MANRPRRRAEMRWSACVEAHFYRRRLTHLSRVFGHAGAGGVRSRVISDKMSANICLGTATSASWKVTYRPWLTTFAPILISFSRRLVSDHGFAIFGIASVHMKLPILYARAWS